MSIVIHGMDIPEDCYECPFADVRGIRCQPNYFDFTQREECPICDFPATIGDFMMLLEDMPSHQNGGGK